MTEQPAAGAFRSPLLWASVALLFVTWQLVYHRFNIVILAGLLFGVGTWLARGNLLPLRQSAPRCMPASSVPWRYRLPIILVAFALAAVAFTQASDNQFRTWGVLAWIGAVLAWLAAWWPVSSPQPRSRPSRNALLVGLTLIAIVALGAWERFSQLPHTPAEPTSDHAEKLLDITDILNGTHPVFFERNTGREPLQFYFTAYVLIRGLDMPPKYQTLKVGMAIADTAAIIAVYLLAAELFGAEIGLVAALLHATAAWSTINGVFGLRPSLGPLTAGLALWALLRFLRTRDRRDALLTGLLLGTGLYGYTAFRTVPIVAAIVLLIAIGTSSNRRRTVTDTILVGTTAAIVFVPLARYVTQYWDRFWYRTETRAGSSGLDFTARIQQFAENYWHAAQMFHWRGDVAWVSFAPGEPALDFVSGAALLIGSALIVRALIGSRDLRAGTVLLAIPVLLLSSTLALAFPQEVPSFARSFLVAPLILMLVAVGLVAVRREIEARAGRALSAIAVAALLVIAANRDDALVHEYDVAYRATVPNSVEIAHTIAAHEPTLGIPRDDVYLLGAPFWLDHRNVAFELGDIGWADTNHLYLGDGLPLAADGRPIAFVFNLGDRTRIAQLWTRWPDGSAAVARSSRPGKQFGLFIVNEDLGANQQINGIPLDPLHSPCVRSAQRPQTTLCLARE